MNRSHRWRVGTASATPQARQKFLRALHASIAKDVFDSAELRVMTATHAHRHEHPFVRDFREQILRMQQRSIAVYIAASRHDSYR